MGFQTDTLKSLCEWLATSDSYSSTSTGFHMAKFHTTMCIIPRPSVRLRCRATYIIYNVLTFGESHYAVGPHCLSLIITFQRQILAFIRGLVEQRFHLDLCRYCMTLITRIRGDIDICIQFAILAPSIFVSLSIYLRKIETLI